MKAAALGLRLVFGVLAIALLVLLVVFQFTPSQRLETWSYVSAGRTEVLNSGGQDIVSLLPVESVSGTAAAQVTRQGNYLHLDSGRSSGLELDITTDGADFHLRPATTSQGSLLLAPYPRVVATMPFDPTGKATATTEFVFPNSEASVLAVFPQDEAQVAFDKTRVVLKLRAAQAPPRVLVLFKNLPVVVELRLIPGEARPHLNQLTLAW